MTLPTNADRANFAAHALHAFANGDPHAARFGGPLYGEADRDLSVPDVVDRLIGDLLADLQHLSDRVELDWDALIETGRMHHDAEVFPTSPSLTKAGGRSSSAYEDGRKT